MSTDAGLGPKNDGAADASSGSPPAQSTAPRRGVPVSSVPSVSVEPLPCLAKDDPIEVVLAGFGKDRPDRPHIAPSVDSTPPAPAARAALPVRAPRVGERERPWWNRALYMIIGLVSVGAVALLAWSLGAFSAPLASPAAATFSTPAVRVAPTTTPAVARERASVEAFGAPSAASASAARARPTAAQTFSAAPVLVLPPTAATPPLAPATSTSARPPVPDPRDDVKRTM